MITKEEIEEVIVTLVKAKQTRENRAKNEYIDMAYGLLNKIKRKAED